ncbi:MAG: hypothetical protein IIV12_03560, partial [Bacteroidales bacterium]|nr:hypothetical protein [Bacteroidales bacterium]
ALRLATRRAVEEAQERHFKFSQIVIDGKVNFLSGTSLSRFVSTAVKADDLIKRNEEVRDFVIDLGLDIR